MPAAHAHHRGVTESGDHEQGYVSRPTSVKSLLTGPSRNTQTNARPRASCLSHRAFCQGNGGGWSKPPISQRSWNTLKAGAHPAHVTLVSIPRRHRTWEVQKDGNCLFVLRRPVPRATSRVVHIDGHNRNALLHVRRGAFNVEGIEIFCPHRHRQFLEQTATTGLMTSQSSSRILQPP